MVQRAIRLFEEDVGAPSSLARVARILGASPRTLARRFRLAVGVSPQAFRQTLRIDTARRLLESGDLNVQEVAREVGYQDPSAFYRSFVKTVGIAPRAYQQRFRS